MARTRTLSRVVVLSASLFSLVPADRFVVTERATESVSSSGVENVNFVKYIAINESPADPGVAISILGFSNPGRVFVDYVDYKDGGAMVTNATLAVAKVSGDTFQVVNRTRASSYIEDAGMPPSMVDFTLADVPAAGHLLVEVSVFRANKVKWIAAGSQPHQDVSLEVVAGDGVAFSAASRPQFSTDSSGYLTYSAEGSRATRGDDSLHITATSAAAVYVVTTDTPLNLYELSVAADEQSNVYVEGAGLAASADVSVTLQNETRFVAVFQTVETEALVLSPGESGEICLDVGESLATGRYSSVDDAQNVALPGATGGFDVSGAFPCGKMQIPKRVPRDISLLGTSLTPASGGIGSGESSAPLDPSPDNAGAVCFPLLGAVALLAAAGAGVGLL